MVSKYFPFIVKIDKEIIIDFDALSEYYTNIYFEKNFKNPAS